MQLSGMMTMADPADNYIMIYQRLVDTFDKAIATASITFFPSLLYD